MSSRVAIVTGAAGDLGKYIARRLAADGLLVACNDLAEKNRDLNDLVSEITDRGGKAISVIADISIETEVERMVEMTVKELGSLDVIICNVGIFKALSIDQMDEQVWEKTFSVNVKGTMFCYKWAAKQMIKQGKGGKLIGGCSVAGLTGAPLCSAYSSSKFAIRGLTQTAAMEYARFGITANAYAPGFIGGTKMWENLAASADAGLSLPAGGFEGHSLSNVIKMGRLGLPEDIAGLVAFLSSTDSAYITGQTYSCDGGMHIA